MTEQELQEIREWLEKCDHEAYKNLSPKAKRPQSLVYVESLLQHIEELEWRPDHVGKSQAWLEKEVIRLKRLNQDDVDRCLARIKMLEQKAQLLEQRHDKDATAYLKQGDALNEAHEVIAQLERQLVEAKKDSERLDKARKGDS